MGKLLIICGIVLIVIGLILHFNIKIPGLGQLPGDIRIERENFTLYFPITTMVLLSLILSGIFYLINLFRH